MKCSICKKKQMIGSGTFFRVPKDDRRLKWSKICCMEFTARAVICKDHFAPSAIATIGQKCVLLPSAIPIKALNNIDPPRGPEKEISYKKVESPLPQCDANQIKEILVNKSSSHAKSAQSNTRLCGLVQSLALSDEFLLNCTCCCKTFSLEKWKMFVNHFKEEHFENNESFKSCNLSQDHNATPLRLNLAMENIYDQSLVDPLEISSNSFAPVDLKLNEKNTNRIVISANCIQTQNSSTSNTLSSSKPKQLPSGAVRLEVTKQHPKKATALSRCLKRRNVEAKEVNKKEQNESDSVEIVQQKSTEQSTKSTALSRCLKRTNVEATGLSNKKEHESDHIEIVQQKSTEITFEYTPRDIVDFLLDSMKNHPVLWQFDNEPFNEDFYEAVEVLCKIINEKWSLNIDNLKMRRSINRILRFYCYLFPNTNIENIDRFTCYYDKCATFLPAAVSEIAYARCSHCYICYRNNSELKRHLLEEYTHLQWPYKCVECKECFVECDDYEFHKRLPHYDEIFRCEPCNKTFFRGYKYNKHVAHLHPNGGNEGKYRCDICSKAYKWYSTLRIHKKYHGERKYKCGMCPKSYFEKSKLNIHLKGHEKQFDYVCEVCGKEFLIKKGLTVHMKKHTGEKVTCNICNLKLRKSSLRRHLRLVHVPNEISTEPGFKNNPLYYRRLIRSKPLQRTLEKCGKERNYGCKICNVNFENYKLITEHNKTFHPDVPKWPCKMCSTEFNIKTNLKRHYRRKHNLDVIQVYKLVDENEDLNVVLSFNKELLGTLFGSNVQQSNKEEPSKSDSVPRESSSEEQIDYISEAQDEIIIAADDIETHEYLFAHFS